MSASTSQAPTIILNKRQGRGQRYDEVLAEGILPLRMMLIPAGTFMMGSPAYELDRTEAEGPQHKVTLAQFFMAKYPITQAQWRVVATIMPRINRELKTDPAHFKGELRPVERVSWADAVEFCHRLTVYTSRQYRLPTEAEWEYACRAGTTTPFHFGETITTNIANYRGIDNKTFNWSGSYGEGPKGEYRQETTPVNYFEGANVFGLYSMHGNVLEWCQDYWHETYNYAPTNGSSWLEGGDSSRRILRGGSWNDLPGFCRSACRDWLVADNDDDDVGFRVVCSTPELVG